MGTRRNRSGHPRIEFWRDKKNQLQVPLEKPFRSRHNSRSFWRDYDVWRDQITVKKAYFHRVTTPAESQNFFAQSLSVSSIMLALGLGDADFPRQFIDSVNGA
jgi:hypothetical protein